MHLQIMIKFKFILLFVSASVVLTACERTSSTSTEIKSETIDMTSDKIASSIYDWWQGDYHNDVQITDLKEDGAPIWQKGQGEKGQNFGGHLPVSSHYRQVGLPSFGDRVLYLEEFTFKDDPYRQRIYTIIDDKANDQVRVKLWYFKDKETYKGAWTDLNRLESLTPENMSPLPDNCDLYVELRDDGRLDMKMPKDQCKFGSSIFDYQVRLGPDDFWFRDRIVDADTMLIKSTAGSFGYHKLNKIK